MNIPTREQRIRHKVETCLNIQGSLFPYVSQSRYPVDGGGAVEIDAEARTSAEATFIRSCNVLDGLLDALGDSTHEGKLEDASMQVLELAKKAEQERATTSQHLRRPSVLFHPEIARHVSGTWIVFIGDISDPETSILGAGQTPEEAMLDFDVTFRTRPPEVLPNAKPPRKRKKD